VASVLIRRSGGGWEPPGVTSYENEAELQDLVRESPELVGASAAVVALREFALPNAGSRRQIGYFDLLTGRTDAVEPEFAAIVAKAAAVRAANGSNRWATRSCIEWHLTHPWSGAGS
jgi:hypothetical protein